MPAKIYQDNIGYVKAGVMLSEICQHDEIQLDLFEGEETSEANTDQKQVIMAEMDELNTRYKADIYQQNTLFIASEGVRKKQTWQVNRQLLSPCYTTRISDLLVVK